MKLLGGLPAFTRARSRLGRLMFPDVSGNIRDVNEDNRDAARRFVEDELVRRGWTRSQLATKADVDPKTLRSFLDGSRWPQADKRAAISKALEWDEGEIDWIESTGEHRYELNYVRRDDPSQTFRRQASISWRDNDLVTRYTRAVEFASVADGQPSLEEPASNFIEAAIALWRAARALQEGGDGNADNSGGPAPTSNVTSIHNEPVAAHDDPENPPGEPED